MLNKIKEIKRILEDICFIHASVFDKGYNGPAVNGSAWNRFVHDNCLQYGFEVWKRSTTSNRNVYVKDTDDCKAKAIKEGFVPWTTQDLYRGEVRI